MTVSDEGSGRETTDFGFERVALNEKQGRVDSVFHSVARRYDVMNDLMSAGLHRAWKAQLVSMLRPSKTRPYDHLDVAGGTGDVAFRVLDAGGPATQVTVLDINESMLRVGAERAPEKYEGRVNFVTGNAESLPLPDASFDSYTIAFGIRNVPRIDLALSEARRVLKPGGRFLCLEFSASTCRCSTRSTRRIPSTSSRASARGWRAMRIPIATSWSRSASSRRGAPSPA